MAQQIHAIYENGVLRPLQPLNLPELQRVRISINGVIGDSEDVVAKQRAARVELDAQLAMLPDEGHTEMSEISELDRSLYGRPE
jgi:predicted DNA-binding antitoxin AbrB/MazE fold protein